MPGQQTIYAFVLLCLTATGVAMSGCSGECEMQSEVDALQSALAARDAVIDRLQSSSQDRLIPDSTPVLMHIVFAQLKPGLELKDRELMIEQLRSLSALPYPIGLWIGEPAATGDPRLADNYQLALQVLFRNEADLAAYQKDQRHLDIRAATMKFLAGPPLVYDYWIN